MEFGKEELFERDGLHLTHRDLKYLLKLKYTYIMYTESSVFCEFFNWIKVKTIS